MPEQPKLNKKLIRYVFHPVIYAAVQKKAKLDPRYIQFKNKPMGTAFNMVLDFNDSAKLDQQIQMSCQIQIPTSFSLTLEDRRMDRETFIKVFERIVKIKKYKMLDLPEYFTLVNNVIVELIENAEKAILESVAPDIGITKLTSREFRDPEIRKELVELARKQKKESIVVFEFIPSRLTIYVTNNIFANYATIKRLEDKTSKGLSGASTLASNFKHDNDRIGAGLGLTMAKTILDDIARKSGVDYEFGPGRDKNSHVVMKINFVFTTKKKGLGQADGRF